MFTHKLIDAMSQIDIQWPVEKFLSDLDESNIEYIALFPRAKLRRVTWHHGLRLIASSGDRVIPGSLKRNDQRVDLTDSYVEQILNAINVDNVKFLGELMFTHADKHDGEVNPTFERHVNASSPNVIRLLDEIAKNPIPVMFHWEVYHWDRDWPNISSMLERYPTIKFIWPHCGFGTVDQIDYVMSRYPNVYPTLSKRELIRTKTLWISHTGDDIGGYNIVHEPFLNKVDGALIDITGTIKSEWIELLTKYQDRFMFATDAHKRLRWESYTKIVAIWRDILGQLDYDLALKLGYTNAARIYNLL